MPKATKRTDPHQMAVDAVQQWHDNLLQTHDSHTDGHIYQLSLGDAFGEIEDAIEAENAKERDPGDSELRELERTAASREAGYLIGVQVGLRLRGGR